MILVTGATGNVGGELIQQLTSARQPVRALVRDRSAAGLPPGVETAVGDLDEPGSLHGALNGVRAVFLLGGYRDMPGLLTAIRHQDVERVVLLSSRSVIGGRPDNAIVNMWLNSEGAVQASGVSWTILRPSGFMSNALRWKSQLQRGDVVRAPFANAAVAAIDPADIAAAAAIALSSDGHASQSYAITGPEPLRPADQVRILGDVLGRNLRFSAQSDDEARQEMSASMPSHMVDAFFRFFVDGEFDDSPVVSTVADLTKRQPRTFQEWASAARLRFVAASSGQDSS
jgi:uncharacterized protein YbjT (DUF2867 family)